MGEKLSRDEIRAMLMNVASTPYGRFKDKVVYFIAKVAIAFIIIWALTHADGIIDWWNGK
jgi:hypothetical protein